MACTRHLPLSVSILLLALGLASCGGKERASHPAYPESNVTYAISRFAIPVNPENPMESMKKLLQTIEALQSGTPFLEVAKGYMGDGATDPLGGWMGFVRPQEPDAITGAYQAVQPGNYGGPIQHERAANFVFRHTFDEGREIEKQVVVPAYGFFLPNNPDDPEFTPEQSEQRAKDAWGKISRGELTLAEAAKEYDATVPRPDAFLGNLRRTGRDAELCRVVEQAAPGELAPLGRVPGAFVIVRHGEYFRSHIRHILVQHTESPNRPLTVSRSKADASKLADKILAELKDGSLTWRDAVLKHSDDVGTAGLLGWIGAATNGDMVPDFEEVILATEPGGYADKPVELEDGFHILYRVN